MPLRPKALMYQAFLRRFIQFEAGLFSLRLGHGTALTCPRHVIHLRAAASLPSSSPLLSLFTLQHGFFYRQTWRAVLPARHVQLVKKPRRVSRPQTRKAIRYVFCRDMCVAENTLRGVSVELSACQRTTERRTKQLSEKVAKPLFSTVSHGAPFYRRALSIYIYTFSPHQSTG